MNSVKKISVFVLLATILLGSIGVTSFEHVCSKSGASISYFIPPSHHCKDEKKTKADKKMSCCENNSLFDEYEFNFEEKPCCSNAVDYIYLDSDRTNTDSQEIDLTFEDSGFNSVTFNSTTTKLTNTFYRGPPPLPLLVTLAKLQTYII